MDSMNKKLKYQWDVVKVIFSPFPLFITYLQENKKKGQQMSLN